MSVVERNAFMRPNDVHDLSWGISDDRMAVFGSVTADSVGDFVRALDTASRCRVARVDITGLDYLALVGIQALVDWRRRHGDVIVEAAPDVDRLLRHCLVAP